MQIWSCNSRADAGAAAALVLAVVWTGLAPASMAGPSSESEMIAKKGRKAHTFCENVADRALDARFAWQRQELIALEKKLDERVKLLSAKIAEYKKWVARREKFSKRANAQLIEIYAKMRPDAASQQLSAMKEETAAALISKLPPRKASVILSEMEASKAAQISSMIKGAARIAKAGKKR